MKINAFKGFAALFLSLFLFAGCGENTNSASSQSSSLEVSLPCIGCHGTAVSPVTDRVIAEEWRVSLHNTEATGKRFPGFGAGCGDCHEPDPGHPNNCGRCHGGTPTATNVTGFDLSANPDADLKCLKCHHTLPPPHFTNFTSGTAYPAAFINSNSLGKCRNCHNPHDPSSRIAANREWAAGGHGNAGTVAAPSPWSVADFKTRGNSLPAPQTFGAICVRCHTTTGFINFVNSGYTDVRAWGTSSDKTKETLACNACHDDGRGNSYSFKVRSVTRTGTGITTYYNYSAVNTSGSVKINDNPTAFPDAAASNLCMFCHVGRANGALIKLADAKGLNFGRTSRISSHDFLAGGVLYQKSGFEFYTSASKYQHYFQHDKIGMGNTSGTGTDGPCISCHMSSSRKHLFTPVSSAGGTIQAVTSTMCANCHKQTAYGDYTLTAAILQAEKDSLAQALSALRELEKARNLYTYNATTNRWTYTNNWNSLYGSGIVPGSGGIHAGAYTMGASFNSSMLPVDPGGYAHNRIYAKMLVYDSIDWLYDGSMNLDTETAINWLYSTGRITQTTRDTSIKYLQGTYANPSGIGGTRPR